MKRLLSITTISIPRLFAATRYVIGFCATLVLSPAMAAEVSSLAWDGPEALQIRTQGSAEYKVETLEQGLRLRLVFSSSTIGPNLAELPGQGLIKGVYPYLAENGTAVNLDLLLNESGKLDVQKTDYGYRVAAMTLAAESAPAPAPTVAAEPAATPAPAPVAEAPAAPAPAPTPQVSNKNVVQDVLYAKLPGDRVQITIKMSQPPVEPTSFSITNPARVSFDFPKTRLDMAKKTIPVKEGAVSSVTAVEAEDRTRLVLNLIKPVAYRSAVDGNNFVVTVEAPGADVAQAKTTHFTSSKKGGKYAVKSIDFRRGDQGDGKIVIALSDPAVGIDLREQAGEIILDFIDTSTGAELQRRLDVVDFATPVQTIDTFVQGKNTRMVISPKGKYEQIAYQTGNVFTVSIKPVIERPDEKKVDEFGYSGEKLSLNFQNIDVRAALQVLADFTGLNFVVSDTVKGSLTLRLKDVPWDQALDLIVDSKGLAVRKKGNVISVAPASEVQAKEKAAFESTKSNIELEPLVSELIQISYAKAEEIAILLKSIKPVSSGTVYSPTLGTQVEASAPTINSNTLLSPRGQVTVDARTNSLLIQDTTGKIKEVRKLIAQLDLPVRQVMVESRLVEATDNFSRSLGVRLGHSYTRTTSSGDTITAGSGGSLFNVNLPSQGVGGSAPGNYSLSFLHGTFELDLELSALEQIGNGKIISSPRIITANQKKAIIEQGQERAFIGSSISGAGTLITKKATLKLEVTPQITPDNRVNLDVVVTKDNFVSATDGLLNVKQIQTQVLLDNGETVVIGGVYEQDKNLTTTQVPFFGDLPLLGNLFKNKELKDNKTELLIFLTPRILSQQLSLR